MRASRRKTAAQKEIKAAYRLSRSTTPTLTRGQASEARFKGNQTKPTRCRRPGHAEGTTSSALTGVSSDSRGGAPAAPVRRRLQSRPRLRPDVHSGLPERHVPRRLIRSPDFFETFSAASTSPLRSRTGARRRARAAVRREREIDRAGRRRRLSHAGAIRRFFSSTHDGEARSVDVRISPGFTATLACARQPPRAESAAPAAPRLRLATSISIRLAPHPHFEPRDATSLPRVIPLTTRGARGEANLKTLGRQVSSASSAAGPDWQIFRLKGTACRSPASRERQLICTRPLTSS